LDIPWLLLTLGIGSSSGIQWRKGVIVTANHGVRRDEDINVLLGPEESVPVTLAGRDRSTDPPILKLSDDQTLPLPGLPEASNLELANFIRSRS
jgi:S1-C subfamily serine protease